MQAQNIPDGLCECGCGAKPNPGRQYIHGHNPSRDRYPPVVDRFWAKVNMTDPLGCWDWVAASTLGYGTFFDGERVVRSHRYAYELLVGPIPEGLEIDHLCRNTLCVNPSHLEPVTSRVNCLRSMNTAALNAAKTHCKHGHEFTPENTGTRMGASGVAGRWCRACHRIRSAERRANERRSAA